MASRFSPALGAGVVSGLLFYVHALIPNSHSWPLLWPLLGGALAVYFAARQRRSLDGVTRSLGLGLRAGIVGALVFLLAAAPTLYLLAQPFAEPLTRLLGGTGPLAPSDTMFIALGAVALVAVVLSAVGGAFAHPFLRHRTAL